MASVTIWIIQMASVGSSYTFTTVFKHVGLFLQLFWLVFWQVAWYCSFFVHKQLHELVSTRQTQLIPTAVPRGRGRLLCVTDEEDDQIGKEELVPLTKDFLKEME